INLKMVIAGEVLSQPKYAIGSNLQLQKMYLNTSGIFAWIIIILFIAKLFEYILERVKFLCIKSRI
ncbi:MAG TPA: ABC transporter permease, partial [Tissierella sp.]|nr:ABC transporter permease [Tissierella sp.]